MQLRYRWYILEGIELKWHGVGGRTGLKTVQFDLFVVELFKPDIVILQLGTNDLNHLPSVNVGSAIEDLTRSPHDSLNAKINVYVSVKLFIERGSYF